ncbi:MAG: GYDIA family GHMP kinase [Psychroserpens sp.]|uniref:GYDIA family GHMP kinase n=1 Tax=Psychroserpens sp. TaxID=2020870 RepID=UPI003001F18B
MKSFYSHGKLLLTGEYVVLDGAIALAVPTVYGQSLDIENGESGQLKWISLDENGNPWFETKFDLRNNKILKPIQNDDPISHRLLEILNAVKELYPEFLNSADGYKITTELGFPKNWGLGTSSTLISNIARWATINPYQLLEATFGGSGYDIACARALGSLTYQLRKQNNEILNQIQDDQQRSIKTVDFSPSFHNHIYFVHLNQKQNSREGIAQYRANTSDVSSSISAINSITERMITCDSLSEFQKLMEDHEQLISTIIKQKPVKQLLFNDFNGSIKSLGAWGGDFIMVASDENPTSYFTSKGYHTILSYSEMILNPQ